MNIAELAKCQILEIVTNKQGCKFLELIPCLSKEVILSDVDLDEIVSFLICSKELIAVSYTLESMPYREKLFLLPKDTKLSFFEP